MAATGLLGLMVATHRSEASIGGTSFELTASDGSATIRYSGGQPLTTPEPVTDAAWSPDGSRAVYVTTDNALDTVRYDEGLDVLPLVDPTPAGTTRRHPTWSGTGSVVTWAEKVGTQPYKLMRAVTAYGGTPQQLSPDDGAEYTHPDGGPGGLVTFQRQIPGGTPEAWLYDPAASPQFSLLVSDARSPSMSPDGQQVALVRTDNGGHDQIYIYNRGTTDTTQLTSDAVNHDNPVWAPTGNEIAFNADTAIQTVMASGGSPSPTLISGLPAYQPGNWDRVVRLAGANRFATAVAVSRSHWATDGDAVDTRAHAKSVILSRSDNFADALGGSALAAAKEAPLLLTAPTGLNTDTQAEIGRILGGNASATVYLLGGTGAISAAVETTVRGMGYQVVRLAGANRFETSVAISKAITPSPDLILAATGLNFPDALAAGAAAGSYDVPSTGMSAVVVLTADTTLPTATKAYLDANPGALLAAIGGQAATATASYHPLTLVGANRYETALFTAEAFFGGEHFAGVATGANWPDALAGGALMATVNGPVLLTRATATLADDTAFLLDWHSGSISTGLIFGGSGAIDPGVDGQVAHWISGPGGFTLETNATDVGLTGVAPQTASSTAPSAVVGHRSLTDLTSAAARLTRHR